jgi:hypothetical protein
MWVASGDATIHPNSLGRKRVHRQIAVVAIGLLAAMGATTGAQAHVARAAQSPSSTTCTPGTWTKSTFRFTTAQSNGNVNAATIVSSNDVWAVGNYFTGTAFGSLWERWNGRSWSPVSKGAIGVILYDVTSFGADDVVAVGGGSKGVVIAHYNGTSVVRYTVSGGATGLLESVSGTSASDVWAEGTIKLPHHRESALLYHYNGTTWTKMAIPSVGADTEGQGVIDHSASDVELLLFNDTTGQNSVYRYDGTTWSLALSAVPIWGGATGNGFAGASDSDLYGIDFTGVNGTWHWNGTAWTHEGPTSNDYLQFGIAEGPVGTEWAAGTVIGGSAIDEMAVTLNGVRQTNPASIMNTQQLMTGVATGSGLVVAVSDAQGTSNLPIAVMSCD